MALSISFKNQLAFVTGGTRGIGKTLVEELAACEANIIFTGTGETPPPWLTGLQKQYPGQKIDFHQLDLSKETWINALEEIIAGYPGISVCINNAGINIVADIREVKPADLRQILEINLTAPAIITSHLAKGMAEKKYGRIVNISSIFGVGSRAGRSSYSAAKSGLIGQTRAVALDLAKDNILVNAVCPGFVSTDLTRRMLGEKGMQEVSGQIPLGRLAETSDIAPAVLFLASPLNTYITGQTLIVDGGYLVA
ncbi:MAG: SDR family oxidoreductase [Candidatus Aminicenantes bacterium]|nr:SDR family oxidoreductase [Candidatus Aminicenantes bacterium]